MRRTDDGFDISFVIHNPSLIISQLLTYTILGEMTYQVNKEDLIDSYKLDIDYSDDTYGNDGIGNVQIIFKHLFRDIGIPQFYHYMKVTKLQNGNKTTFHCVGEKDMPIPEKVDNMRYSCLLPIDILDVHYTHKDKHTIECKVEIKLNPTFPLLEIHEKILKTVSKKIFKKTKKFIEETKGVFC